MPGQPARLAFQTITRDVDIQLMDLDARPVNGTIESKPFANSTRIEGSARFSPDGSRIAFASFRSGAWRCGLLAAMAADFGRSRRSAPTELVVGGWSPDGARIVFDGALAGNSDVYVVGADGGHLRRLTSEPSLDGLVVVVGRWLDLLLRRHARE